MALGKLLVDRCYFKLRVYGLESIVTILPHEALQQCHSYPVTLVVVVKYINARQHTKYKLDARIYSSPD